MRLFNITMSTRLRGVVACVGALKTRYVKVKFLMKLAIAACMLGLASVANSQNLFQGLLNELKESISNINRPGSSDPEKKGAITNPLADASSKKLVSQAGFLDRAGTYALDCNVAAVETAQPTPESFSSTNIVMHLSPMPKGLSGSDRLQMRVNIIAANTNQNNVTLNALSGVGPKPNTGTNFDRRKDQRPVVDEREFNALLVNINNESRLLSFEPESSKVAFTFVPFRDTRERLLVVSRTGEGYVISLAFTKCAPQPYTAAQSGAWTRFMGKLPIVPPEQSFGVSNAQSDIFKKLAIKGFQLLAPPPANCTHIIPMGEPVNGIGGADCVVATTIFETPFRARLSTIGGLVGLVQLEAMRFPAPTRFVLLPIEQEIWSEIKVQEGDLTVMLEGITKNISDALGAPIVERESLEMTSQFADHSQKQIDRGCTLDDTLDLSLCGAVLDTRRQFRARVIAEMRKRCGVCRATVYKITWTNGMFAQLTAVVPEVVSARFLGRINIAYTEQSLSDASNAFRLQMQRPAFDPKSPQVLELLKNLESSHSRRLSKDW